MNVNAYNTKDYENKYNWTLSENKPNSNPIHPPILLGSHNQLSITRGPIPKIGIGPELTQIRCPILCRITPFWCWTIGAGRGNVVYSSRSVIKIACYLLAWRFPAYSNLPAASKSQSRCRDRYYEHRPSRRCGIIKNLHGCLDCSGRPLLRSKSLPKEPQEPIYTALCRPRRAYLNHHRQHQYLPLLYCSDLCPKRQARYSIASKWVRLYHRRT